MQIPTEPNPPQPVPGQQPSPDFVPPRPGEQQPGRIPDMVPEPFDPGLPELPEREEPLPPV